MNLKALGVNATAIHGGFSQNNRTRIMDSFRMKDLHVLVCTDVAARGLDIKEVSHIYNYDIPKDSKEYIHRVGRTARAGEEGKAISLLSERDFENFRKVLEDPELNITQENLPKINTVSTKWLGKRESGRGVRREFGRREFHRPEFRGRKRGAPRAQSRNFRRRF
jgi:ATP-dependent RNA helicase DeaD